MHQLVIKGFSIVDARCDHEKKCVGHLQFVGWGGCEISFCVGEKGVDWGCLGSCVKVTSMSAYSII